MKVVTAGILRNSDGEVLLVRRAKGESLAGFWEFPGGKVEQGEADQECLRRELYEELEIDVEVSNFFEESHYSYDHGEFRLRAYEVDLLAGEPILRVHDQLSWVTPDRLLSFQLAPADIPIARSLSLNPKPI